jgi:benzoate membrane transport protein
MASESDRSRAASRKWRQVLADFGPAYAANGFIGWLFAATGPVAIILSIATAARLGEAEIASWLFGVFFINGIITIFFCLHYRQPLAFFWTIPGTVLVGPALAHFSFAEVIGAYYATGLLMLILGASGWVGRAMKSVPMPIVMGMVAGVFLRFGLDLVRSLQADLAIAGPMVAVWLMLSTLPALGRKVPPLIGALLVGVVTIVALGRIDLATMGTLELVRPALHMPEWSWPAMVELVVPLAITVLVVQNGQGVAVLKAAGHDPPVNAITVACGIGAMLSAAVGSISTCLTGPTNAILTASGERSRQYTGGIVTGTLAILFGLMAPACTRLLLNAPKPFIMALAGLAMLRVLQAAFVASFASRFTLGALVCMIVTIADIPLFNIGAAFWGLVAGFAVSWLMERRDFSSTTDR